MNTEREHMELAFRKDFDAPGVPVARVAPDPEVASVFIVEFVDKTRGMTPAMRKAVRNELKFYLVEKEEQDPWRYAKYHATTASNIYSSVTWSLRPELQAS